MRVIVALALFLCAACAQYNPRDGSRTVVRYVAPRPAEYVPQYPSSNPLVQFRVPGPYSAPAPPAPFEQRQPFSQYAVRPQAFSVPPTHYVPPAQFRDAAPAQPAFSVPPSFYAPPAPSQSQDSYAAPDQDVPAEEAPAPAQANSGFSGALNFVQQAADAVSAGANYASRTVPRPTGGNSRQRRQQRRQQQRAFRDMSGGALAFSQMATALAGGNGAAAPVAEQPAAPAQSGYDEPQQQQPQQPPQQPATSGFSDALSFGQQAAGFVSSAATHASRALPHVRGSGTSRRETRRQQRALRDVSRRAAGVGAALTAVSDLSSAYSSLTETSSPDASTWARTVDTAARATGALATVADYAGRALPHAARIAGPASRLARSAPAAQRGLGQVGGKLAVAGQALSVVRAFGSGSDEDLNNGFNALGGMAGGDPRWAAAITAASTAAEAVGAPREVRGALEVATEFIPSSAASKMLGFVARAGKRIVRGDMNGFDQVVSSAGRGDSGAPLQGYVKLTEVLADVASGKGLGQAIERAGSTGGDTTIARAGSWMGDQAFRFVNRDLPELREFAARDYNRAKDSVRNTWNRGVSSVSNGFNRLVGRNSAPTTAPVAGQTTRPSLWNRGVSSVGNSWNRLVGRNSATTTTAPAVVGQTTRPSLWQRAVNRFSSPTSAPAGGSQTTAPSFWRRY